MEKFRNKYRIQSKRMPDWNYAGEGIYYITLVTQDRICHLGKIENEKMIVSDWGNIVKKEWLKSFDIRQELFCDEYVIMPNHLHAIVVLNQPNRDLNRSHKWDDSHVETHGRASQNATDKNHINRENPRPFIRKPKSISSFIAGFKSGINSKIDDYIDAYHLDIPKYNRNNHFFQPNYHDHVIRKEKEYERIRTYIVNNPKNWQDDKFRKNDM